MKNNTRKYRTLCETEKNIPVFSQAWWLDSVCGMDNWDVVFVEKGDEVIASMPYYKTKRAVFDMITMPVLTQTMGPYIKYPQGQSYEKRLSFEKDVMTTLIEKLPNFDLFTQNFHYDISNWLPFYWKDFKQTTRYTYVIEDLSDLDRVFSNFNRAKRKNIKRSENELDVYFDLSAKDFYENHKMTLAKQNSNIVYDFNIFEKMYKNGYKNNAATTIYAVDAESNIHSALFVIWDKNSAYNLISTIDPDFRNSGSASLLIKEIITLMSTKTTKFDFEGSMIENVENSFRQFGAIQKPYSQISKTNSCLLHFSQCIRALIT